MALRFAFAPRSVPSGTQVIIDETPITGVTLLLEWSENIATDACDLVVLKDDQILDTVRIQIDTNEMVFWNKDDGAGVFVPPPPKNGTPYRCLSISPAGLVSTFMVGSKFFDNTILFQDNK